MERRQGQPRQSIAAAPFSVKEGIPRRFERFDLKSLISRKECPVGDLSAIEKGNSDEKIFEGQRPFESTHCDCPL